VAPELVRVAVAEPADLIYAGTAGGLAVAAIVARRMGLPYALDLEDFHTGELIEAPQNNAACSLMKAVEQRVLSGAAFLTTSSEPIAAEYNRLYSVTPHVIHNVFPLPQREPDFTPSVHRPLTLFWFSQVVGPNRGLEDVISAATQLARPIHIRLLGHAYPDYLSRLKALAGKQVVIEHIPPVSPDRIDEEARRADVGLATEQTTPLNRDLCITNKIFTYMLAGLAIAATNTQGQQLILSQEPAAGFLYVPGDTDSLATKLQKWADDPMALVAAKRASWEAAKRRWHWEHPLERGTLLKAVERVIGKP
jgi:glycosyltransferase involved in cell wall biosynthesis